MRSQLSGLEKLDMGRVRRRTSRKARSMTLVVRTFFRRRDVKKVQQIFQIALTHATARGRRCSSMFPLAIGAQRFAFAAGAIDGGGFGDTAAFLAADLAAIGDNQPEIFSLQSAQEQILQELHPGGFAFSLGELV